MEERHPNYQPPYYEEDEIDLYELWLTIKKRWKVIALTAFMFFILSGVYIIIAKPVYKSDFTVKKGILSPGDIKIYLKRISDLIEQKKYDELAKLLNVDKNVAKDLVNIEVNQNRKEKSSTKIELYTYSTKHLNQLEKAILDYLNKNPFVQKEIGLEKEKTLSIINSIDNGIKGILKIRVKVIKKLENKLDAIRFNPAEIDEKIVNLQKQKCELERRLKDLKGFEIKVSISIPYKPYKPKKALILAVSVVTGLILGIFLAFFLEWLKATEAQHREEMGNK